MPLGQLRSKALERDWVVVELDVSKHGETEFRRDIAARLRGAAGAIAQGALDHRFQHAAAVLESFAVSLDASGTMSAGVDVEAAERFADTNLTMDLTDAFLGPG